MAILDEYLEMADATSVAAAAGTALIGDVIDLGATTTYIGDDGQLYFTLEITTQIITGGTAGAVQFFLASDAQAAIATDGTATVHMTSVSILTDDTAAIAASGTLGASMNHAPSEGAAYERRPPVLRARLPAGTYERYLGVLCTTSTTTTTAGAINAFLSKEVPHTRVYDDAL